MTDVDNLHYPERLGKMVIINSPWALSIAWKVIRSWLDTKTQNKIGLWISWQLLLCRNCGRTFFLRTHTEITHWWRKHSKRLRWYSRIFKTKLDCNIYNQLKHLFCFFQVFNKNWGLGCMALWKSPVLTQQITFIAANGLFSYVSTMSILLARSSHTTETDSSMLRSRFFV